MTRAERERRLDEIRRQAIAGEVPGAGVRAAGGPLPPPSAASGYYGKPLLKPHNWTWEIPLYFFAGGAAGAAAVVGAASRLAGEEELARDARWIAAVGGAVSGALLVSDLGRPERFLHMLRIVKPQSPMSVGAWTLVAFSTSAGAAAFADLVERRSGVALPVRVLRDAGQALSAATGTVMASYTGVLLGVSAIPAWNRSVRVLPVHFTASGLASAVALLELLGHRQRALDLLGLAAAGTETAVGAWKETRRERAFRPLSSGRSGALVRLGGLLSGPLPLALRLLGARRGAGLSVLSGSLATRFGWLAAGTASARDPAPALQLEAGDGRAPEPRRAGAGSVAPEEHRSAGGDERSLS